MSRMLVLAAGLAALGCRRAAAPIPTGEGRLAVPGGRIWYTVTGTGSATPLVLLHGGPGFSSFYLKAFEALGDDRPVIRYDQLGGGKSDRMSDTAMFTIPHFVAELDSLRAALRIARWHLLGHSWGTILALEYYRAHPDRVASLTFASPVFDLPAYERHARDLLATLSDSSQQAVRAAEAAGKYDTPAYQNAMGEFYGRYVFRHPVQADLDSVLPRLAVPTLFTVGEFDEVGPELVKGFADSVPGARYVRLAGAAHLTPWDAREANLDAVRRFLAATDSAQR